MKKIFIIIIAIIIIIIIAITVIATIASIQKEPKNQVSYKVESLSDLELEPQLENCPSESVKKIVKGNSLSGLIENGEEVKILLGHYDCYEIEKKDIVVYEYAGSENPIIKIVKAVPGDKFSLKEVENPSSWNVFVNDAILVNSENQPYILNRNQYNILFLYENDYKGVIPQDAYMILGNLPSGAIDSTSFGLVHKNNILGKVSKIKL